MHTLELPGFGGRRRSRFTLGDATDEVARVLEGLGPAHLVGHSLGGLIAARVAARRPELVERLVLIAPAGALERRPLPVHAVRAVWALRRSSPRFALLVAQDALRAGPRTLLRVGRELLAEDVVPELGGVVAPTLLVWGDRDPLVPPRLAERFVEAIPNVELELVRGARHVPMLERPREVDALIRRFLA